MSTTPATTTPMAQQMPNVSNPNAQSLMAVIEQVPVMQLVSHPMVQQKFIANYNASNKEKNGEMAYHRQLIHFNQTLMNSADLQKANKFSLYACFVTAAVEGWSFDPNESEIYMLTRGGKAYIQPQAGAHVKRLVRSAQVIYCDPAKLVYKGDEFLVQNGRVVSHIEKFESEEIIAGYVRFVIDKSGNDKFFIYRRSDWESWRKKSQVPNGPNWNYDGSNQPQSGFLKTKIILHAAKEKTWFTGRTKPEGLEEYNVIDDREEEITTANNGEELPHVNENAHFQPTMIVSPAEPVSMEGLSDEAKAGVINATAQPLKAEPHKVELADNGEAF